MSRAVQRYLVVATGCLGLLAGGGRAESIVEPVPSASDEQPAKEPGVAEAERRLRDLMAKRRARAAEEQVPVGSAAALATPNNPQGKRGEPALRGASPSTGYDAAVAEAELRVQAQLAARRNLAQRGADAEAAWKSIVATPAADRFKARAEGEAAREGEQAGAGALQDAIAEAEQRVLNALAARRRAGVAAGPPAAQQAFEASLAQAEQRVIARLAAQRAAQPERQDAAGTAAPIAADVPEMVASSVASAIRLRETELAAQRTVILPATVAIATTEVLFEPRADVPQPRATADEPAAKEVAQPPRGTDDVPKPADALQAISPQVPLPEAPGAKVVGEALAALPSTGIERRERALVPARLEPRSGEVTTATATAKPVVSAPVDAAPTLAHVAAPASVPPPAPAPAPALEAADATRSASAPAEVKQIEATVVETLGSKSETAMERDPTRALDEPAKLEPALPVSVAAAMPSPSSSTPATPGVEQVTSAVPVQTPVLDAPIFAPTNVLLRWTGASPLRGTRVQLAKDAAFTETVVDLRTWGNQLQFARPKAGTYYLRVASLEAGESLGGAAEKGPVVEQKVVVPQGAWFESVWK